MPIPRSSRAVVAVQSVLILGMIWAYAWPGDASALLLGGKPPRHARSTLLAGFIEVAVVLTALAAATQGAYMSGIEGQETVQRLTIVLFALARGFQVWQNFAQVGLPCRAEAIDWSETQHPGFLPVFSGQYRGAGCRDTLHEFRWVGRSHLHVFAGGQGADCHVLVHRLDDPQRHAARAGEQRRPASLITFQLALHF